MHPSRFIVAIGFCLSSTAYSAASAATSATAVPSKAAAAGLPRIGTRYVPGTATASESLPIDKPWDQLLASQQAQFKRSWYDDMPDADEPPYPLAGPAEMMGDIIKIKQALTVTGPLFATVLVDEAGKAVQVTFHQIPDERLREVLGYALLKPQFKPARCGGKACVMEYPVMASFEGGVPAAAPVSGPAATPAAAPSPPTSAR